MAHIGDRIRELRGNIHLDQLAEKLGVHPNTIRNYENGKRSPDTEFLAKLLEEIPGTNPGWLLTGEGARHRGDHQAQEGYVMFPRYEIQAGAGPGRLVESEQVVDFVSFKEDWVRSYLRVPRQKLALLNVKGDSMSPTMNDGDLILIDMRSDRIEDSAIYVIEFDEALLVKRIQRRFDGSVAIKSDNPFYEPEIIPKERAQSLRIVGRVIWTGKKV
ncbi:XRE family transcriptional regulator [Syntrophotalea acetylenica]|uniref:HTH cro/C1-type domain-containing protein n=2 Tax=Syntrophotalea acetylenica TaxID=29542 RepID=A0A1L3GDV8_SYNAC|nr:helix-turn-helix transcriptional regulator [Syntrophotalea acetylenica]APG24005.1 hypothetical protein A7E75_02435 [Syntrophotalea acetylenica]APG44588.1 hypothetical protein A6070_11055 [Syntrophotalea acetylenica]